MMIMSYISFDNITILRLSLYEKKRFFFDIALTFFLDFYIIKTRFTGH
ncbi:hypothetical protein E4N77_09175 [Treponema denticola]|nr:hypothetical protein E4N77_09175 [Treponema denticola]